MVAQATPPSVSALGCAVQDLDERIVHACNDLMRMQAYTPRKAVDNANERARLKRECEQREGLLETRIRERRQAKNLSLYHEACDQVFAELGIAVPAVVASRQAQLLLHVHMMTVLNNQTELLSRHKRRERLILDEELNTMQQEQCRNESHMLREIMDLEEQIKDIEEQIANCPLLSSEDLGSRTTLFRTPKREVSSSSNETLETASLDMSLSVDEDDHIFDFAAPMVQSPRLTAPRRPKSLVGGPSLVEKIRTMIT